MGPVAATKLTWHYSTYSDVSHYRYGIRRPFFVDSKKASSFRRCIPYQVEYSGLALMPVARYV